MKNQFTVSGYNITTDPQFQKIRYGVTPELDQQLDQLFFESNYKKNKKIIDKLTQLIVQYPKVPVLKNYLSVAYNTQENYKKSIEVNQWMLIEHPDYLFGKINEANAFIEEGKYDKVPEIIGEAIDLKALYPDRDLFHLSEVTGFFMVAVRYFVAIENLELAENRFEILKKIAPDHRDTKQAEAFLFEWQMEKVVSRFEEENKQKITPSQQKIISKSQKTAAPKFNHSEIQNLYNFGVAIPPEKLKEVIALPHSSLVEDLEKILVDAFERYNYFKELEWHDETHNSVLHALFLLKEINAVESLPKIFAFLKYDDEFIEFWLGDHVTASLWECFYSLGFNNTAILKEFLLLPGVNTYCKTAVTEAFCQMVFHHPEKKTEILTIFLEVFTVYSEATLEDNLIDSDFLGLAICYTIDCNLYELLPIIKVLYDKCYVSIGITGIFDEVEEEFAEPPKIEQKRELYNIFERYDDILNTWYGYRKGDEKVDKILDFNIPKQIVSDKIGRNEPCPCGSGKKYKKCCINK